MNTIPKLHNTLYLRFKDIPTNGRSGIYYKGIKIGEEKGVSCYHGVIIGEEVYIILPHSNATTYSEFVTDYENGYIPLYIIDGDEVGEGSDKEPILQNVKIISKIIDWRI